MPEINHTVILVVGFEQQTSERFENQCDRINGLLDARIERVQTLTDAREKISDTQYDVVVICGPANAALDFARPVRNPVSVAYPSDDVAAGTLRHRLH